MKRRAHARNSAAVASAGEHRRPQVVDQREPFERLQYPRVEQPVAPLGRVGDAVEAFPARVEHDQRVVRNVERQRLGVGEQRAGLHLIARVHARQHGEHPLLVVRGVTVRKARLLDHAVAGAHAREPGLEDPGVHDAPHRFARGLFERVPEIGRLGVPELVPREIVTDPGAERVGTEPPLEHAEHRAALLVREKVEHPVGVFGCHHLVLDGARVLERVDIERGRAAERELVPRLPLGLVLVDAEVLHERGEGFVEPDAVPPLHGHEVAEPHVRDLVHDGQCRARHLVERDLVGIEKEPRLAERDAPEVLHRAEREVGERDEIALLAGVRDAVIVSEEFDREGADVEREAGEVAPPGHVRDPYGHSTRVDRLGDLQRADDPCDQIRRHRDRLAESDTHVPVGQLLAVDLGPVRQCEQPVGDHEGDREDCFELGLVEAGERGPGVRRLELRRGQDLVGAGLVDVGAAVEAEEPVADLAVELQLQHGVTGRECPVGRDHEPFELGVDGQGRRNGPVALAEGHEGHLEALGVEHDRVGGLGELERDDDLAGERGCVQIRGDQELVAARTGAEGQSAGVVHRGRSVGAREIALRGWQSRPINEGSGTYAEVPGGGPQWGRKQWRQPKRTT